MRIQRLYFDISYTRLQADNVGITRTVRRMFDEFRRAPVAATPVAFSRHGFQELPGAPAEHGDSNARGWLFRCATSAFGKFTVTILTLLPWPLFRPLWEYVSARAYGSGQDSLLQFKRGDVILLGDASWNYGVWTAARRAQAQGAWVVLVVYDIMPLRHPEFCAPLVIPIFKGWLAEMLACTDCLVCISDATRRDLQDWARTCGRVLPPTGYFHLGSDPSAGVAAGDTRAEIQAFLGGAPCFAAVGSLEPKKNYGFLLETFERMWSEGENVRLLIAGRPTPECSALERRLRMHPLAGTLLMTVFDASDAEVAAIYSGCRALVFSSLMEGFGLPLVEARARGSPVIASDIPVFVELADQGVFLYRQNCAAALRVLLREHMREDHRVRAGSMRSFSWADSTRQCLEVIEQLLPGKS